MIVTEMKVEMGEMNKRWKELADKQLLSPTWHQGDNREIIPMCFDRERLCEQKCPYSSVSSH